MEMNWKDQEQIENLSKELRDELKWIRQLMVVIMFILIVDFIL